MSTGAFALVSSDAAKNLPRAGSIPNSLKSPGVAYWMLALSGKPAPVMVTGDPGATSSSPSKALPFSFQSRKVAGATGARAIPFTLFDSHTTTKRLVSRKTGGASSTV
jgi:hypothetical protein